MVSPSRWWETQVGARLVLGSNAGSWPALPAGCSPAASEEGLRQSPRGSEGGVIRECPRGRGATRQPRSSAVLLYFPGGLRTWLLSHMPARGVSASCVTTVSLNEKEPRTEHAAMWINLWNTMLSQRNQISRILQESDLSKTGPTCGVRKLSSGKGTGNVSHSYLRRMRVTPKHRSVS